MKQKRTPRTTPRRPRNMTLCWFCRNAIPSPDTGDGCSWSGEEHTPVPGWIAQRNDIYMRTYSGKVHVHESYRVKACPEFIEG